MFEKVEVKRNTISRSSPDGETLSYYMYKKDVSSKIDSVMVYIHGLVSDLSWFRIPDNVPDNMAILYIRRQPKNDTDDFMRWYENHDACLNDFIDKYHPLHVHLAANCFGTLIALLWTVKNPEKFTTLTLCNPIIKQMNNFGFLEKSKIIFNNIFGIKTLRRIFLTAGDFSRIPGVTSFIENASDTTFYFSDKFLMQVIKLRKWLDRNLIDIPVPLHQSFSYEDKVVDMNSRPESFWKRIKPFKTDYFLTDHFIELMPQHEEFWNEVFGFIKKYEPEKKENMKIKTVLVTGATGFLGRHVIKQLMTKGFKVIVFVRNANKAGNLLLDAGPIEIREGDVNDLRSIENACKGIDAIVHAAGMVGDWGSSKEFRDINVEGTKNLAIISHNAGIRHFVLIGSLGVFGDRDQDNINEDTQMENSSDKYSNSKIEQEFFIKKYFSQNGIPYTIIRPGFIYGEDDNNFMPRMIDNLKKNKLKFIGSGLNHINTVYVGNVAVLVSEVIGNKDSFFKSYNITDNPQVTIGDFVRDVSKGLGMKIPDRHIPLKVALTIAKCFEEIYGFLHIKKTPPFTCKKITFMARDRVVNSSKAYSIIGEKSVSYETGMKKTIDHLIKQNGKSNENKQRVEQ